MLISPVVDAVDSYQSLYGRPAGAEIYQISSLEISVSTLDPVRRLCKPIRISLVISCPFTRSPKPVA